MLAHVAVHDRELGFDSADCGATRWALGQSAGHTDGDAKRGGDFVTCF